MNSDGSGGSDVKSDHSEETRCVKCSLETEMAEFMNGFIKRKFVTDFKNLKNKKEKKIKLRANKMEENEMEKEDDETVVHENEDDNLSDTGFTNSGELTNCETSIQRIPFEILTEILSYVPLRQRKNMKLVCNKWYEAASFLNNEKLIFSGFYEISTIITTLMASRRKFLNLEFNEVVFKNYPLSFWQDCGPKIRTLRFYNCELNDETIGSIIMHCKNLRHLSLKYPKVVPKSHIISMDLLGALAVKGITINSLISLKIDVTHCKNTECLSNFMIYVFFSWVFPNIKNFTLRCNDVDSDFRYLKENLGLLAHTICQKDFRWTHILLFLWSKNNKIERLGLLPGSSTTSYMSWIFIAFLWPSIRLKVIEFDMVDRRDTNLTSFFSSQKDLESVKCNLVTISDEESDYLNEFLLCLFHNCPKLRYLKLEQKKMREFSYDVKISFEFLEQVTKSQLAILSLSDYDFTFDHTNLSALKNCPANYSLRSLTVFPSLLDKELQLFFVGKFPYLQHLDIGSVEGDEVLQTIWKTMTELRSLLFGIFSCSDYGFTGKKATEEPENFQGHSIRNLKKLELLHLRVYDLEEMQILTPEMFSEFVIPNLRFVDINIELNSDCQAACLKWIQSLNLIEYLRIIYVEEITFNSWIEIVRNLKRLRFLDIDTEEYSAGDKWLDHQYSELFTHCPKLRVFRHTHKLGAEKWIFDVIEQKAVRKTQCETFLFGKARISPYYVHHMDC